MTATRGAGVLLALLGCLVFLGCSVSLREGAVQPTTQVPAVALADQNGRTVELGKLLAQGPVVVIFYRGHWCMYCRLQLADLAERRDDFAQRGARVVAISTDSRDESSDFAARLERSGGVSPLWFPLLTDPEAKTAEAWGVAMDGKAVAVPSAFIVRQDGSVAWSKIGERVSDRPVVDEMLTVLDSL